MIPNNVPGRVLFDASNIRVGGGVQVAASMADGFATMVRDEELIAKYPWLQTMCFFLSPEVAANLVKPIQGLVVRVGTTKWNRLSSWLPRKTLPFDLQLTVFGPRYGQRFAPLTIVGIADVTSVYQWPEGVDPGSLPVRLRRAVRGMVSRQLFARESYLVSESSSLINTFVVRTAFPKERITVVPNALNQAVANPENWRPLSTKLSDVASEGEILFGYVARAYPHKNLEFLSGLQKELKALGLAARFVLTLSDSEWGSLSEELRAVSINVGVIPVSQVANLFMQCDAAIFPSLLESFSATPLEAMATNGLLFASNRSFVRDICGDAAVYIDPLDAKLSAGKIMAVLSDQVVCDTLRRNAHRHVASRSDANERAMAFADLISVVFSRRETSCSVDELRQ